MYIFEVPVFNSHKQENILKSNLGYLYKTSYRKFHHVEDLPRKCK